ncbi:branched-subunit amino acid aminotransferase/4-amino-4-deoxychorismate lyase [Lewinella aquimaris]|uniref:branched-chain-amino-acid transaminase n=1 Tax=Neolewinella aquimaris TaxID=1835722 RepID=A0A840E7G8_9BACT|nr:aminotransferase class IV [Neolewinella aquimaris]MBB4077749.1 branched-subunit amino acid aminotransferase/4-amino-4-deoxychorismate lyase [Neolewinella aquimaris]
MLDQVYVNGKFTAMRDATLHVSDLSILRGYAAFDYFRYSNGTPRFLEDHLARFRRSAAGLHLDLPQTDEELRNIIGELIERNGGGDGGMRLILTGGYADDGYTPRETNLLALPNAHKPPPDTAYLTGCLVMMHRYERQLPEVKSIDYIEGIRIKPLLRAMGADYPVYVDRAGNVRESDRSNVMIVQEGTLVAPVDDILLGITRKHLILLAERLGIPCEQRRVSEEEFRNADEAIICSTIKGPMPIGTIDRTKKPVGPVTLTLMEAWESYA